ncbi:LemA family protein, partial [Pseudomonas aeruginosa]
AYNQLITLDNKVEAEWSQVENVMQRRADLIPNLVSSVQGSMTQEKEVLKEITEARKAYAGAKSSSEKGQANEQIEKGLGNFVTVLNEDYPKLASSENV